MITDNQVHHKYDFEHDILYIDIGIPCAAYSEEVDNGIFIRINPTNNQIVGATIFEYKNQSEENIVQKTMLPVDWRTIRQQIIHRNHPLKCIENNGNYFGNF